MGKAEASEGGVRKEDPERKRRPWTEDCEPTQRQHQLSNQHLPHWTEGLLLRSLSQPRFLWPLVHCSRIYCQPVRKCPIRLQRAGCEFRQAVRNKGLPSTSSWPPAWRGEPRGVPLDLPRSQPEQRLHRQLCCHSQRQQQQQWTRHKEGCHRCPQAQECPTEWALEDPCWRVRCQWLQPPRDSAARGVHYCQAFQAPSVQSEHKRDLCRRSGWKGRLYWRRRQSSRLPGTVWQVDSCWTRHLGRWMRQRCPRSLRQDVTFHPVDK